MAAATPSHLIRAWYPKTQHWRTCLTKWLLLLLNLGLQFFAITPLWPSIAFVQHVQSGCWLIEIFVVTFYVFYNKYTGSDNAISSVVTTVLFTAKILAHFTVLLEVIFMRHKRKRILEVRERILLTLREHLQRPLDEKQVAWHLAIQLFVLIGVQVALITLFVFLQIEQLHWLGTMSILALKCRILEFLSFIVMVNGSICALRRNIDEIGSRNLQCLMRLPSISVHQEYDRKFHMYKDEQQLILLKNIHNDLNLIFRDLNDYYGWSLLAITTVYFVDFVCNSYWILLAMLKHTFGFSRFIRNSCFMLRDAIMLSMLCWHCQKSINNSRKIGCLVFKLVKPLGNKRYNDLVSDFSLQTLHQQFTVTAKDFFQLNLNLLGNMVAAIVTYLVILLQFMLSEKSQHELH